MVRRFHEECKVRLKRVKAQPLYWELLKANKRAQLKRVQSLYGWLSDIPAYELNEAAPADVHWRQALALGAFIAGEHAVRNEHFDVRTWYARDDPDCVALCEFAHSVLGEQRPYSLPVNYRVRVGAEIRQYSVMFENTEIPEQLLKAAMRVTHDETKLAADPVVHLRKCLHAIGIPTKFSDERVCLDIRGYVVYMACNLYVWGPKVAKRMLALLPPSTHKYVVADLKDVLNKMGDATSHVMESWLLIDFSNLELPSWTESTEIDVIDIQDEAAIGDDAKCKAEPQDRLYEFPKLVELET